MFPLLSRKRYGWHFLSSLLLPILRLDGDASLECQTTENLDTFNNDNIVIAGLKLVEENCLKEWKLFYRNLLGEFSISLNYSDIDAIKQFTNDLHTFTMPSIRLFMHSETFMEVAFLVHEKDDNKIITKLFNYKDRALHYKPPDSSIIHGRWNRWYRGDYLNLWSLSNGPHGLFETTSCLLTFPFEGQEFECENRQFCYVDELSTFKKGGRMCLWDSGVQDKVLTTLPYDTWFYDLIYCNEFLQRDNVLYTRNYNFTAPQLNNIDNGYNCFNLSENYLFIHFWNRKWDISSKMCQSLFAEPEIEEWDAEKYIAISVVVITLLCAFSITLCLILRNSVAKVEKTIVSVTDTTSGNKAV